MPTEPKPRVFKTDSGWTWTLPSLSGDHYSRHWLAAAVAIAVAEVIR